MDNNPVTRAYALRVHPATLFCHHHPVSSDFLLPGDGYTLHLLITREDYNPPDQRLMTT